MNTEQVFGKNEKILILIKSNNISHYMKKIKNILSTVAGVTISTCIGDNGLLTKVSGAKQ